MWLMRMNLAALLVGFVLDLIIGDPEGWPHPVILIGRFISFAERKIRARGGNLRVCALLLSAGTVMLAAGVTAVLLAAAWMIHPAACFLLMCVMSWWCISCRCLAVEAKGVYAALGESVASGRRQVARIVGRDTANLSESGIVCAAVETVAENTTDGVISPMLYLALGGPVLGMAFKAASTLDSMVGYLDEKYRDIGWASAKLDDLLNYVPARICGPLLCLAAALTGMDGANALRIMLRDHAEHLSPNCAWSEAAAAGALHIQLGGTHEYFGKTIKKPAIGDKDRMACRTDILCMVQMMYAAALEAASLLVIIGILMMGI